MALGSEVDYAIWAVFFKDIFEGNAVRDVPFFKNVVGQMLHVAQVFEVARVSERVEVDDFVVGVFLDKMADEVGANEAGAAGDEDGVHWWNDILAHSNTEISKEMGDV